MCCCEGDWECVDNKCVVVKGTGNVLATSDMLTVCNEVTCVDSV